MTWKEKLARMQELDNSFRLSFPDINGNWYLSGHPEQVVGGCLRSSGFNDTSPAKVVSSAFRALTDGSVWRLSLGNRVRFNKLTNIFENVG